MYELYYAIKEQSATWELNNLILIELFYNSQVALKSTYMFVKYDVTKLSNYKALGVEIQGIENYVSRLYKIETPVSRLKRQKNLTLWSKSWCLDLLKRQVFDLVLELKRLIVHKIHILWDLLNYCINYF